MDSPAAVRFYARRSHLDLPFYTTEDEDIPSSLQLNQYPSTFISVKGSSLQTRRRCRLVRSLSYVVYRSIEKSMMRLEGASLWTCRRDTRVIVFAYLLGLIIVRWDVFRHAPMPLGTLRIGIDGWRNSCFYGLASIQRARSK